MEYVFAFLVAGILPIVFILGMIKPDWLVSNRLKIKKKRWFIFFMCFILFWIFAITGSLISESKMTPAEKIARYNEIKIEKEIKTQKKEKEKQEIDSTQKVAKEKNNEEKNNAHYFTETSKGDFIDGNNSFSIEVLKIKDKKRNAGILEGGYGKYRYFYLKITNITKNPKAIDRDDFYVESEDGAQYEHNTTQAIADFVITINRDAFGAGQDLAPNVPAKGVIAFEIPKEGKFKLKFKQ